MHGGVDRRHAAADHHDPPADRQRGKILGLPESGDVVDGVDHVLKFGLPRQAELVGRAEAHAEEDRVVVAPQVLKLHVAAERLAAPNLDAPDRENEIDLPGGEIVDRLIGGDAVFVEAARLLARFEDRAVDAGEAKFMRASQARRPRADDRDPLAGWRPARIGRFPGRDCRLGRIALQLADHDRLRLRRFAHARFLAERFGRADAGAHAAHDVGIENGLGRPGSIAGGDLADEERNVDRGRAGLLAGRVEAEIAALGFDLRLVEGQRRVQVGEIVLESLAVQASRADVRRARRIGGDRHLRNPRGSKSGQIRS